MDKDCIPYGSDVCGGRFKCQDCGHEITIQSSNSLPPCPKYNSSLHYKNCWKNITGKGDHPDDPYPNS